MLSQEAVVNLSNCDREPIHIPGSIQPHGLLLVLNEVNLVVLQASENTGQLLGVAVEDCLERSLAHLLDPTWVEKIRPTLASVPAHERPMFLGNIRAAANGDNRTFNAVAHKSSGGIVLELELTSPEDRPLEVHPYVDAFSLHAEEATNVADLSRLTAEEVRRLTSFDRVLIYRFDEQWNGTVVGEVNSGRLPALLEHRFPASDIPAQARELYRVNRLRLIPNSGYRPVSVLPAVHPVTGKTLDMSFSTLRSVSPIHVEYMQNMDTAASMSVSILREGKLWGLISCHHKEPKGVPFAVRTTCDLLARIFSLRLAALEHHQDFERRIEVRSEYSRLLAAMTDRGDFAGGLVDHPESLLALVGAQGAAVITQERCSLVGETPTEGEVLAIAEFLLQHVSDEVYATDSLPGVYPASATFKDRASGLLAISVSKLHPSYVMWFRPEVIQTIKWGGDPRKPVSMESTGPTLHPRRSFETWKETVRDKSLPWKPSEIAGAADLRNAIVGIVLRKVEQLAQLNAELVRSNKELEAFSYSVSHDLRAPLRHIVGYAEMLREKNAGQLTSQGERCVTTIIDSSEYAGILVDKLLAFSRMGRAELQISQVDVSALVRETQREVMLEQSDRQFDWQIGELCTVNADLMMLRQAVRNLLDNAVKYTRTRDKTVIEIGCREEPDEHVFWVRDNGVGFDQQYANKLFGVFQRLHRMEEYEGTGIGLANVRRVMERHGGRTWAEGKEGEGATFYFTLPKATL